MVVKYLNAGLALIAVTVVIFTGFIKICKWLTFITPGTFLEAHTGLPFELKNGISIFYQNLAVFYIV